MAFYEVFVFFLERWLKQRKLKAEKTSDFVALPGNFSSANPADIDPLYFLSRIKIRSMLTPFIGFL